MIAIPDIALFPQIRTCSSLSMFNKACMVHVRGPIGLDIRPGSC
jgi:hypothetical protein